MNNKLQFFQSPHFGQIRVVQLENGEPMFCLIDVCKALDLTNPMHTKNQIIEEFGDYLHQMYPIPDNVGRLRDTIFITEPQLYFVMNRSDKPQAKPFRMWVNTEILPTIRKHGAYLTPAKIEDVLSNPDTIIQMALQLKEERAKKEAAEALNHKNAPKVLFADSVTASNTSILVGEMAKILKQNGVDMGQNRLFEWLRANKYIISRSGTDYNMPTQLSMEMGLFEIKETSITHSDGHISISKTPKITGKGQVYFVNKFLNRNHCS